MSFTEYFSPDRFDSPATEDDLTHAEEKLGVTFPDDLRAFWLTTATYNGNVHMADGTDGPYLRVLHPSSVTKTGDIVVFGRGEDWDFGVAPGHPTRWVDVERDSGEELSELGATFVGFLESLRNEHAEQDDLFA